jgi:hypothetical protein
MHKHKVDPSDADSQMSETHVPTLDKDTEVGLTDDERVSREGNSEGKGARVTPGPADAERIDDA